MKTSRKEEEELAGEWADIGRSDRENAFALAAVATERTRFGEMAHHRPPDRAQPASAFLITFLMKLQGMYFVREILKEGPFWGHFSLEIYKLSVRVTRLSQEPSNGERIDAHGD
ncbi:hypothetical protein V3C99_009901 [Haemonchus contortus]